jgi:hypothetical protein
MSDKKVYTASDVTAVIQKGMSDFQIKNFVVGAQMTPMKQLHQAAIEIEAREGTLKQSEFEEKKQNLKIRIITEKLKVATDPIEIAELELEQLVIENKLGTIIGERTRLGAELKSFYDVIDYFNENYDIDEMLSMKDTLEIDYWVKRLSRQASLDLVSSGRVSNGNLSAMMDLPDEIFQICLKETYKLSAMLAKSVPMPALAAPAPDEEFLIKFGPEQNAPVETTTK